MKPLNPPIRHWRGRRVWIVGASSGIGAALARRLRDQGARLALSARNRQALNELAAEGDHLVLPFDVTDPDAVSRAAGTLKRLWGAIDLLVYAAGTHQAVRADQLDAATSRLLVNTNLTGALYTVGPVIRDLLAEEGAIALIASVAGYRGLPTATVYGPTKAALINLAETLYLDLAPRGQGVFLFNPGFVDTPLTRRNEFPMPDLITADEAAEAMLRGFADGNFETAFPRRFTLLMRLLKRLPRRLYFPLIHRVTGL